MKNFAESKASGGLAWQELIHHLDSLHKSEQYYRILPYLELCNRALKNGEVDCADPGLIEQIQFIIRLFIKLDEIAHEKNYRKSLGRDFIEPFVSALQSLGDSNKFSHLCELVKIKLPYIHDVAIKHASLCGHNANCLSDFLGPKEDTPLQTLLELHKYFVSYAQEALEQLGDIVIVMRVIDYWQVLKLDNFAAFEKQTIAPLLAMGEHVLDIMRQSVDLSKKEKALRLIILLQMFLRDHPEIKKLKLQSWPQMGFASSFFTQLENSVQVLSTIEPVVTCALLKDSRSQLRDSRSGFRDKDNAILIAQQLHSEAIKSMLREMFEAAKSIMGRPPCELVLCVLGSTGRLDRRPCSDIEYMVLHGAVEEGMKKELQVYIGHVISVFELMILRLGESPAKHADSVGGFRIDTSALEKKLWGTPKEMAERFVSNWIPEESAFHGHHYRRLHHVALPLMPEEDSRNVDTVYLVEEDDVLIAYYHKQNVWRSSTKSKLALGKIINLNKKEDEDKNEIAKVLAFFETMPADQWLAPQLYEYLEPSGVNQAGFFENDLLKEYRDHVEAYLQKMISEKDQPGRVDHILKWGMPNWWKGLNQGQAIALICLHDLMRESTKVLNKKFQSYQVINLKKVYYKPLVYFALNIKLYLGWKKPISPIEILRKYCDELKWGGEEVFAWLKAALSFVIDVQVKMHLDAGYQKDTIKYSIDSEEEKMLWAGMDLISEALIKSLETVVKDFFEWSLSMEAIAYSLLKKYLNIRHAWLDKWVKKGIARDRLLSHALIQALAIYPDESGWSPRMELVLNQHLHALENLSQLKPPTRCQLSGLPTIQELSYLPDNLVSSCFESSGKFKGEEQWSGDNSQVRGVIGGDGRSWFIKVKESNVKKNKERKHETGLLAREYTAMMLHLLLGGEKQIALGWPIKFGYTDNNIPLPTYVWISEHIPGPTMASVMIEFPEKLSKKNVDMHNFSQLFLFCFLTCPEDGQPENYKVIEIHGKTYLIAFDYGQCFVQAEHTNKPVFGKDTQVLTVKTMIYLLESMDELLANDLITRIRLLNIDKWFEQWKGSLSDINKLFKPLLEQDVSAISQDEREQYTRFIDLDDGALDCIKARLELFQHWLRTTQKPITGNNALMDLEPVLALQYASIQGKIKTPQDFYAKLDAKAYKLNAKGKMISSTSYAQIKERTITPERIQRSCQLESRYFHRIDFRQLTEEQQQFALRLLEAAVQQYGERFFRINLSGCKILTKNRLLNLLTKLPRLEELDLRDCEHVQALTLCEIFAQKLNVRFLSGSNYDVLCPMLKQIRVRIKGREYSIGLNLSLDERKRLSQSMKVFIRWHGIYLQKIVDDLARRNDDDFEKNYNPLMLYSLDYWDEKIRSALLKAAEKGRFSNRLDAVETLGRLGYWDEATRSVLLEAVKYPNARMAQVALFSLGELGHWDEGIRKAFFKAIKNDKVLAWGLSAFGKMGRWDEEMREVLLRGAMDWERKEVCRSALTAIGDLGCWDKKIREALLNGANNPELCSSVISALRKLGRWDKEIRKVLLKAAKFRDYEVADNGVTGLVKLVFKAATKDYGGSDVREAAIVALGDLNHSDEKIWRVLSKAIQDKEVRVRIAAVEAIKKLRLDTKFREGLLGALNDQKSSVREHASEALGNLNHWDREIRDALLRAATDQEPSVRQEAVMALGKLNHWDVDIRAVLISSAKSSEKWVSQAALKALRKSGRWDAEIHTVLISLGKSSHTVVCVEALKALGKLGYWDEEIRRVLLSSAKSRKEIVCRAALEALGKLGHWDVEIRDALLKAVGHEDHSTSRTALEALASLGHWDENIGSVVAKTVTSRERLPNVGILYSPLGCMKYLIQQIKSMRSYVESPISTPEDDKIIKRIFFFVDHQTQRVLPHVCRKWRDLYDEFKEESLMRAIPESRLALSPSHLSTSNNNISFFGKSSLLVARVSHVASFESFEINKAALASQRAIIVCESEGVSTRCRVVPAEPDGDCGFTGTRSVLALVGRTDIDWQISRAQLISLVRNEFEKEHSSCKPIILQIFKTDGIMKDDLNEALEKWCKVFIRKGYWMQEAHFRFLSWIFNLEFCFYCVDNDKNILLPELGNESIYEGRDPEAKIVVNLLHMTVALRDENTQLNHFDGLIINPTLEQEQKINLLLKEGVLEPPEITETEDSQYSQAEKKSNGL